MGWTGLGYPVLSLFRSAGAIALCCTPMPDGRLAGNLHPEMMMEILGRRLCPHRITATGIGVFISNEFRNSYNTPNALEAVVPMQASIQT